MKLHTREQAPKEGGTDAPPKPQAWVPTRVGYARFLAESKVVFGAFESIMAAADGHPECESLAWLEGERAARDRLEGFGVIFYGALVPLPPSAAPPA